MILDQSAIIALTAIAMGAGGPAQHTYVGAPTGPPPTYPPQNADTTGQVAPSGMKPRVTATLWEDEGCMCFQVEAKGVCVARRDGKPRCMQLASCTSTRCIPAEVYRTNVTDRQPYDQWHKTPERGRNDSRST